MKKILLIDACLRPDSRTRILAEEVLGRMEGVVERVNLGEAQIAPLNLKRLRERDAFVENKDFDQPSLRYARQFAEADEIVVAAPYWDLCFPSTVRIYFEVVTVLGITFRYTPEGCPEGLCKAERIIYVTTAGGPIGNLNLGFDFVRAISQTFYGIPRAVCFQAEYLDVKGADVEKILEKAKSEIRSSDSLAG